MSHKGTIELGDRYQQLVINFLNQLSTRVEDDLVMNIFLNYREKYFEDCDKKKEL